MMESQIRKNENIVIYSPQKVAEILEVNEAFVKRQLREGKMEGFKMGKFWRIPRASLDAYCISCEKNGNAKKMMSADTRNKIRFHANLKSQDSLPITVERITETILQLKDSLQNQTGFKRVATIAKLQSVVRLREELRTKLYSLDASLNAIGSTAYPEIMILADMDADSLEELFVKDANSPKKSMVDFIDKKALKMMADDVEVEKEMVKAVEPSNA